MTCAAGGVRPQAKMYEATNTHVHNAGGIGSLRYHARGQAAQGREVLRLVAGDDETGSTNALTLRHQHVRPLGVHVIGHHVPGGLPSVAKRCAGQQA
jgi:hypothetical protein